MTDDSPETRSLSKGMENYQREVAAYSKAETADRTPADPETSGYAEEVADDGLVHDMAMRLYAYSVPNSGSRDGQQFLDTVADYLRTLQSRIGPSDENVHNMALILSEIGLASDWEHATVNARAILTAIKDRK